jgi:hypothetical protein
MLLFIIITPVLILGTSNRRSTNSLLMGNSITKGIFPRTQTSEEKKCHTGPSDRGAWFSGELL